MTTRTNEIDQRTEKRIVSRPRRSRACFSRVGGKAQPEIRCPRTASEVRSITVMCFDMGGLLGEPKMPRAGDCRRKANAEERRVIALYCRRLSSSSPTGSIVVLIPPYSVSVSISMNKGFS